ncbi:MAG: TrmH family RNA methyltransferase [Bacteroidota bacterium]|nr:TrmH family RNA methyltransferase [Bacteroidota bacterium]
MTKLITSLQNPLIKNILLLEEKPRERKNQNLIIIEGLREIRLAILSGFTVTTILYCPELIPNAELDSLLSHSMSSFELIEIPREIFNKMAYRKDSGGVIALANPKRILFRDIKLSNNPLLLVLESVEKPGNLGAILRTADSANLDGVIICDPQTDIYNPNAIRASIGCIFTMPVVTCTSEHTILWLKNNKIHSFATALTATQFYHDVDFRQPSAIIMGSEANGLSKTWLDEADDLIKIPMMGKIDSMNVSASAAVVVYEAMRQRNFNF